jgi:putative endonuclease
MKPWNLYIVRCADGSLYTGIAMDLERRMAEHNSDDALGAKYTRSRRPVKLVYSESFGSRSDAARRESEIKRMKRTAKQDLIMGR